MSGGCWRHRTGEGIGVVGLYSPSQFQLQMTTFIIHTTKVSCRDEMGWLLPFLLIEMLTNTLAKEVQATQPLTF